VALSFLTVPSLRREDQTPGENRRLTMRSGEGCRRVSDRIGNANQQGFQRDRRSGLNLAKDQTMSKKIATATSSRTLKLLQ
jgi:hypothetical protein